MTDTPRYPLATATDTAADLIARLEKATGPDRELERDIGRSLETLTTAPFVGPSAWDMHKGMYWVFGKKDTKDGVVDEKWSRTAPRYTASLDAALTLVPEDHYLIELRQISPRCWYAAIGSFGDDHFNESGESETGPAALSAAALKAREASLQDAVDGNVTRATFYGMDSATPGSDTSAVKCPRCDAPSIWSAPDTPPPHCWDCGLEFRFPRFKP